MLYQLSYSRMIKEREGFVPTHCGSSAYTWLRGHWWGEQDSNLRRRKPADLQSAPVGRLGISPFIENTEPMDGFEPPTC